MLALTPRSVSMPNSDPSASSSHTLCVLDAILRLVSSLLVAIGFGPPSPGAPPPVLVSSA